MPLTCGFGAPGRTRTCTLRIRSPLLYPLSYRGLRGGYPVTGSVFGGMGISLWGAMGGEGSAGSVAAWSDEV